MYTFRGGAGNYINILKLFTPNRDICKTLKKFTTFWLFTQIAIRWLCVYSLSNSLTETTFSTNYLKKNIVAIYNSIVFYWQEALNFFQFQRVRMVLKRFFSRNPNFFFVNVSMKKKTEKTLKMTHLSYF